MNEPQNTRPLADQLRDPVSPQKPRPANKYASAINELSIVRDIAIQNRDIAHSEGDHALATQRAIRANEMNEAIHALNMLGQIP